jgi:hypothetical protein
MPNTNRILCYFNGPFLLACPRVLQIVEPALSGTPTGITSSATNYSIVAWMWREHLAHIRKSIKSMVISVVFSMVMRSRFIC